jgi:hypothetical protein
VKRSAKHPAGQTGLDAISTNQRSPLAMPRIKLRLAFIFIFSEMVDISAIGP